jgi:hypothetical protein
LKGLHLGRELLFHACEVSREPVANVRSIRGEAGLEEHSIGAQTHHGDEENSYCDGYPVGRRG